jgi:hypothetical protein
MIDMAANPLLDDTHLFSPKRRKEKHALPFERMTHPSKLQVKQISSRGKKKPIE